MSNPSPWMFAVMERLCAYEQLIEEIRQPAERIMLLLEPSED